MKGGRSFGRRMTERENSKDEAENGSGTRRNGTVTGKQFQVEIVPCHARRILVYIKTNCCSLRWHE